MRVTGIRLNKGYTDFEGNVKEYFGEGHGYSLVFEPGAQIVMVSKNGMRKGIPVANILGMDFAMAEATDPKKPAPKKAAPPPASPSAPQSP